MAPSIFVSRPFRLRPRIVPVALRRYPNNVAPVTTERGWGAYLRRRLVGSSCLPPAPLTSLAPGFRPTEDERWALAVGTRLRRLDQVLAAANPGLRPAVERLCGCAPPGYVAAARVRAPLRCGSRECPFCHARRVAAHLTPLDRGFGRRPPGAALWAGLVQGDGGRAAMTDAVRAARAAGAVGYCFPVHRAAGPGWYYRAIVLTDAWDRLRGLPARELFGPVSVADLLVDWFYYPYRVPWGPADTAARDVLAAAAAVPKGTHTFAVYGACAAGSTQWVPGKTWFDFAANEPHTEPRNEPRA